LQSGKAALAPAMIVMMKAAVATVAVTVTLAAQVKVMYQAGKKMQQLLVSLSSDVPVYTCPWELKRSLPKKKHGGA
jgi:hypothetical protein